MRRLLRWAFNLAATVSAALFVVVCALCVRSQAIDDQLHFALELGNDYDYLSVESMTGEMGFYYSRPIQRSGSVSVHVEHRSYPTYFGSNPKNALTWELPAGSTPSYHAGFFFWSGSYSVNAITVLFWPYWCVAAVALFLPAAWTVHLSRRYRRKRRNLCAACGYDLRATPTRCPECGAIPAKPRPSST
jgi:hypothetical protein